MELCLESKHFRVTVHWNVLVNNTITNVLITRQTLRYCVSQTRTSCCWLFFFFFQLPEQQPGVFIAGTITSCVTQTKMPNNPETPFLFCFKSQGLTRSPVWRSTWTLPLGSTQTSSETSSWQKPRLFTGCSKWLSSRSHLSPSFLLASDWLWLCCEDRLDVSRCEPLKPTVQTWVEWRQTEIPPAARLFFFIKWIKCDQVRRKLRSPACLPLVLSLY